MGMAANFPERVIAVVMGCAMTDMRNRLLPPIHRTAAIEKAQKTQVDLMRRRSRFVEFLMNLVLHFVVGLPSADLAAMEEMRRLGDADPELAEFNLQQTHAND